MILIYNSYIFNSEINSIALHILLIIYWIFEQIVNTKLNEFNGLQFQQKRRKIFVVISRRIAPKLKVFYLKKKNQI